MKKCGHAWIALRAIDRLGKLADSIWKEATDKANAKKNKAAKEPDQKKKNKMLQEADDIFNEGKDKSDSIKNLQLMLKQKDFIKLVVQGTWIPDNVIKDNQEGHIWKYQPHMGDEQKIGYYRKDHAETASLCFEEAKNTYAWGKEWHKASGFLADRCEAVHQTARDLFLFQKDEMHKLAATLIVYFGAALYQDREKVKQFIANPNAIKDYYDHKNDKGEYVNRAEIVKLRNQIGMKPEANKQVQECLEAYREEIKSYITKLNGARFSNDKRSLFPMFFTDDQIVLMLFALSHYLADAHMPLHCDSREFSSPACGNIHGEIEEEWENWIISKDNHQTLTDILSETERAEKFLTNCFNGKENPTWKDFQYPPESYLKKFDDELGNAIWEDREINLYEGTSLWNEAVGITYASYCLASRLITFDDKVRAVPKDKRDAYTRNYAGEVREIKGDEWKTAVNAEGIEAGLKGDKTRKRIYDFAVKHGGNVAFNYLSLLFLIDAVDCVAKVWAKIIKDHLDITYEKK